MNVLEGRSAIVVWAEREPLEVTLCVTVLLLIGTLAWLARVVDCAFCGGAGRLDLDVDTPEGGTFKAELPCVGCGGRGTFTALDRWVIWFGLGAD